MLTPRREEAQKRTLACTKCALAALGETTRNTGGCSGEYARTTCVVELQDAARTVAAEHAALQAEYAAMDAAVLHVSRRGDKHVAFHPDGLPTNTTTVTCLLLRPPRAHAAAEDGCTGNILNGKQVLPLLHG